MTKPDTTPPAASGAAPALPTDAMIHAAAHAYDVSQATPLVKMRCAISAALARQEAAQPADDGYATAFYEIASVLGIGARADTPENVFRNEMLPKIAALASREASPAPSEGVERIVHLRASRDRRIYIAGPMTDLPGHNFPAFNAKAAELRAEGWHVENPAEHGLVKGATRADYLRWDISRIATCGAIYLLPGWQNSEGACLEVQNGRALDVQFFGDVAALAAPVQVAPAADLSKLTDEQIADAVECEFSETGEWPEGDAETFRAILKHAPDVLRFSNADQGGAS